MSFEKPWASAQDHPDTKLNAYNPLSVMPTVESGHPGLVRGTQDSRVRISTETRLDRFRENDGTQNEKPEILSNTIGSLITQYLGCFTQIR